MENPFLQVDPREQRLVKEIEREQIVHVPLSEYAVGSPRYERLQEAIATANRFRQPDTLMFNL